MGSAWSAWLWQRAGLGMVPVVQVDDIALKQSRRNQARLTGATVSGLHFFIPPSANPTKTVGHCSHCVLPRHHLAVPTCHTVSISSGVRTSAVEWAPVPATEHGPFRVDETIPAHRLRTNSPISGR